MDQLPSDIHPLIFSDLPILPDLYHCSLVNHLWLNIQNKVIEKSTKLISPETKQDQNITWFTFYKLLISLGRYANDQHDNVVFENDFTYAKKLESGDDTNNLFVDRNITKGEAFVQFLTVRSLDEIFIGVTHKRESIYKCYGWGNVGNENTWIYTKYPQNATSMLEFSSKRIGGSNGFQDGDVVTIYLNADLRQVAFFRNGNFVAKCNDLPEAGRDGYSIFVMVDYRGDEVKIVGYGYRCPYSIPTGIELVLEDSTRKNIIPRTF